MNFVTDFRVHDSLSLLVSPCEYSCKCHNSSSIRNKQSGQYGGRSRGASACAYVESYFQEILGPSEEPTKSNRAYKVTLNFLFKYSWRGFSKREVRQAPRYIRQLLRQRSKSELLVVLWSMRSLALLILYTIPFSLYLTDPSSRVVPLRSFYDIFITLIHRGFSVKKIVIKLSYLSDS